MMLSHYRNLRHPGLIGQMVSADPWFLTYCCSLWSGFVNVTPLSIERALNAPVEGTVYGGPATSLRNFRSKSDS